MQKSKEVTVVTKEMFLDWRRHPVTEKLFEQLDADRNNLVAAMRGELDDDQFTQAAKYSGMMAAIERILLLTPDDLNTIDWEEDE